MEQFLSAKYLSGRSANQKIGVVGSTEDQKVLEVIGNVGIGTTVFDPTEKLDVRGSVSVADTITVSTINATTVVVTGTGNTFASLNVTGLSTFGGNIDANGNLDVDGLTDLDDLNVSGVSTLTGNVSFGSSAFFGDGDKINLGDNDDFQIFHHSNGTGVIQNAGAGQLQIRSDTIRLLNQATDEDYAFFRDDGAVELYYDNVKRFETTADGIDVTGHTETDTLNVSGLSTLTGNVSFGSSAFFGDNDKIHFGDSNDLQIFHNGSASSIRQAGTGHLYISNSADDMDVVISTDDGSGGETNYFRADGSNGEVVLYHYGSEKFATKSDGIDVTGHTETDTLNVSGVSTLTGNISFGSSAFFGDDDRLYFGDDQDLEIFHNSSNGNTIIRETGVGNLVLAGSNLFLQSATNENFFRGEANGAVTLYYDNVAKFGTTADGIDVTGHTELDDLNVAGIATFASNLDINASVDVSTSLTVGSATTIDSSGVNAPTGIITASSFVGDITGDLTGVASTATKLQNARDFSITGDFVTAPAISFDGTGNVAFAATVTADSITLGTYTSGDYVQSITGTTSEIEVTGGTGEGSTPQIGLPNDVTITQDLQVNRDVQINRNLNVDGNITIGGTTATLFTQTLTVADADLILGVRTDGLGNDVATDSTANHGGIAIASTEGNPLVDLFVAGIETVPTTYKKIMWFKAGTFSGLGTDAWLSNYAVGIGSTQFPTGTRLAAGNVQVTENDISVVRNINASGIITGTLDNTLTLATSGNGISGSATYDNSGAVTFTVTSDATDANTAETIVHRDASGNFSAGTITANLTGTATTATNLAGGDTGDIPYQSSEGTTTFVDATAASNGQVLIWNGSAPEWNNVSAASGSFGGITVKEEGVTVGTAASVGTINFVGANITATATTGANGISTVTLSDTPTFDSLTLESTDAGSAAAPEFKLYRNSASPADADYLGQIKFAGESDTGVERNYAKITGKISDATNGTEDGIIEFAHIKAGSQNISGRWNSTTLQLLNGTGFSVDGNTTLDGNVDLGNATSDTITATGRFDSGLDPSAADTYDLGSANSWRNINISGISTLGTVKISSGIVTAVSGVVTYYGDGQYLDGINTDLLSDTTPQLGGDLDLNSNNITGTGNVNITGIITATSFVGDGSGLTGVSAGTTPTENTTNQSQYVPFYVGTSTTDVVGISTQSFVFNPSTTRMGIGTDSPQATLHVVDELLVSTSGAASTQRITQRAYTTDNGTLSWEGSAGQLFSVTNNLTSGSIFSVNDVSGIPSIDVDADGTIQLAPYGSTEFVGIGTTAPTAKLHVVGGVNVTGVVTATSFVGNVTGNLTGTATTATNITLADESSDTTCFPIFATDATGDQAPKTDSSALTYNASTGTLSATAFSGDGSALTGISAGTTPTENTTNQSQYIPFYVGTSSTDVAGISTQSFVFNPSTKRMGIGTDAPAYNLHVVGDFAATSKSFVIDHPTKSGKKLRYASLEGPEQGVYVRGRSQEAVIDLPDYWTGLVDEESITANLTPIGHSAAPRVESIVNNTVNVFSKEEGELDYYYTVYAERKDIEKLVVEY